MKKVKAKVMIPNFALNIGQKGVAVFLLDGIYQIIPNVYYSWYSTSEGHSFCGGEPDGTPADNIDEYWDEILYDGEDEGESSHVTVYDTIDQAKEVRALLEAGKSISHIPNVVEKYGWEAREYSRLDDGTVIHYMRSRSEGVEIVEGDIEGVDVTFYPMYVDEPDFECLDGIKLWYDVYVEEEDWEYNVCEDAFCSSDKKTYNIFDVLKAEHA